MYLVFFQCGSCVDQSHDCDLEDFDDIKDAEKRIKQIKRYYPDARILLIKGKIINSEEKSK